LLRQLNDAYFVRLETRAQLRQLLAVEQHWLDRRSLFLRSQHRDPGAALRKGGADFKAWLGRADGERAVAVGLALLLIVACGALAVRARRRRSERDARSGEPASSRAQRAWREVLHHTLWPLLALLFMLLLPGLLAVGRDQQAALRSAFAVAATVLGLYALASGMLLAAKPSAISRLLSRLATAGMLLMLLFGIPLRYLTGVHYDTVNPDLVELGGLAVRWALVALAAILLLSSRRWAEILSERRADGRAKTLQLPRLVQQILLAVFVIVIVADGFAFAMFASWLLRASLGTTIFVVLGIAAAHNLQQALLLAPDEDDADALPGL